ncbi:MAG: hypothetical protein ABSD11_00415 [Methylocella sp.]
MRKRLAPQDSDKRFFDNMEANQEHGKNGRLEDDWENERPILKIIPHMKIFSDQHDFSQGQGIDKSKSLMVNEGFFIQNERFIKSKQTKQNKKIKKYPK